MTSTHISSRTRATPRGRLTAHRLLPRPFRPYTGVDSVQALPKAIHSPSSGHTPASTLFGHSAIMRITGPMSHLLTLLSIDSEHSEGIFMPSCAGWQTARRARNIASTRLAVVTRIMPRQSLLPSGVLFLSTGAPSERAGRSRHHHHYALTPGNET